MNCRWSMIGDFATLFSSKECGRPSLAHTSCSRGKKSKKLDGDFHVRQALGSPERAYTHFTNVLKAQLQVKIHCFKVNPVALNHDFYVHRPP
ncbi:hypothetical protein AYI69_g5993, partial [Smittium culicis]